jgi:mRNA-degrading endonuclease YafQ of YafQ-DinJ toxin-antitoxin module
MFQIILSTKFITSYKKLTKNNKQLTDNIKEIVRQISIDPRNRVLKTHKVVTHTGKVGWSSRVNGDLRIIWQYRKGKFDLIELLIIGGHSGKNKVYK